MLPRAKGRDMKLILTLLLALAIPAVARVGERYETFTARIQQKPIETAKEKFGLTRYTFEQEGISIYVDVSDGFICRESYLGITESQAKSILSKLEVPFRDLGVEDGWRHWSNEDRGVLAGYKDDTLIVSDRRFSALVRDSKKKNESEQEKRLKGL